MTEHPVTTWRERALKVERELDGVKSQALEWKRALDEMTSSDWYQRQHEIESEIERLKKNQCPGLEEHDAYAHMHTRALRAEAEVTKLREQSEIERRESVDLHIRLSNALEKLKSLRAVRESADIFVRSAFVGAYDDSNAGLVRRAHRVEFDNLCQALDLTKDSAR